MNQILPILLVLTVLSPYIVALSSINTQSILSRIQNEQCELQLSVGRIPGTAMPPEWAASGARLGFPVEVEFTDEACADYDMTKERLLGSTGKGIRAAVPLNEPTFISNKGQETVRVEEGAYGCELQAVEPQQYTFRFFLDFPEGATRNDVELPAERIYFMTSCWIDNEAALQRAQKRLEEAEKAIEDINNEIREIEQASSNIFQKAMGFRETVTLVETKKAITDQVNELRQTYPLNSELLLKGPNGLTFVKEGIIAVKRYRGALETREQYHWVGTFSIKEFFEDEDEEED